MPKYKANGYLLHRGKIIKDGEDIVLTSEQAERLGDKVTPEKFADRGKALEDYKVDELRDLAQQRNIEGYNDMKKDELVQALQGK